MNKYDNITILVNSCDKYEDAWYPFFWLLKKYWKNHPEKIILNTEEKVYNCDFLDVQTVCGGKEQPWTKRIREIVEKIDTEYVLTFLDDYFILNDVRDDVFSEAFKLMKKDKEIGGVFFHSYSIDKKYNTQFDTDERFVVQDNKMVCRAHVIITLFRRDYLLKLLCKDENPWLYERESFARTLALNKKLLTQNYKYEKPCFEYYFKFRDGIGITQGKWLPRTKEKFENCGLYDVNFERLGFLNVEKEPITQDFSAKKGKTSIKAMLYNNVVKKIKYSMFMRHIKALYYKVCYLKMK